MGTDDYARAAGWHIWKGTVMGGGLRDIALCPDHSGNQKRQAPPVHLEGEQPLW